jgi:hypothetical protein
MAWHYRIVKYRDDQGYGLHEVYFNKRGEAWAMTSTPCSFACDSEEGPEGVLGSLERATMDALTRGIFEEPEEGGWASRDE